MKKIGLFTAIMAVFASSCKNNSASPNYINATIDGVKKTFGINARAVKMPMSNAITLSMTGQTQSSASPETLSLTINNTRNPGMPIAANTYELGSENFVTGAVYTPGTGDSVWKAGLIPYPPHQLTIVITAIDDKSVKGSFSGDFNCTNAQSVQLSAGYKHITNGEFYVKF